MAHGTRHMAHGTRHTAHGMVQQTHSAWMTRRGVRNRARGEASVPAKRTECVEATVGKTEGSRAVSVAAPREGILAGCHGERRVVQHAALHQVRRDVVVEAMHGLDCQRAKIHAVGEEDRVLVEQRLPWRET